MLDIDLHVHSVASVHAYGTIYDICKEAAKKKMRVIGISDHGAYDCEDHIKWHFAMVRDAPKYIEGVRLLWGGELNVINEKGELDLPLWIQEKMDYVSFGYHIPPKNAQNISKNLFNWTKEDLTNAILNALDNPNIKIITHPCGKKACYDQEKIWERAIQKNILLELNLDKLKYAEKDELTQFKKMVSFVKENNKKLIVGTDTHFLHQIGDYSILEKHFDYLGLKKELIINNYYQELKEFIGFE
jgi:putative hydrolase